jgi:hypothetical protein
VEVNNREAESPREAIVGKRKEMEVKKSQRATTAVLCMLLVLSGQQDCRSRWAI